MKEFQANQMNDYASLKDKTTAISTKTKTTTTNTNPPDQSKETRIGSCKELTAKQHRLDLEDKIRQSNDEDGIQTQIIPPSFQQERESPENLSFAGCGFLGIYHIGVSSCLHHYAPHISSQKISGSSAGALVALAHLCGNLHVGTALADILQVAIKARERALGPFHPSFNINELIYDGLKRGLPEDIHLRASGRLHISLTRVEDGENVIINQFDSKEDIMQAIICSCFIPFWSGFVPPKFKGVAYMDGGFSNNLPILDDSTITVSPFAGEADICPKDDYSHLFQISLSNTSFSLSPNNMYRVFHSLLPPPPEVLSKLYERGFNDAMRYLKESKHISCLNCSTVKMTNFMPFSQADSLIEATPSEDSTTLYSSDYTFSDMDYLETLSMSNDDFELDDDFVSKYGSSSEDENFLMMLGSDNGNTLSRFDIINSKNSNNHDCNDCVERRKNVSAEGLPAHFQKIIQDKCDQVNNSLKNWIFAHRPIKYLSWLAAPCLLPFDISVVIVHKIWQKIPNIRKELLQSLYNLLNFLQSLVAKKNEKFEVILGGKNLKIPANSDRNIKKATITNINKNKCSNKDVCSREATQCNNNINGNYITQTRSPITRLASVRQSDRQQFSSSNVYQHIEQINLEPNSLVTNGMDLFHWQPKPLPIESA